MGVFLGHEVSVATDDTPVPHEKLDEKSSRIRFGVGSDQSHEVACGPVEGNVVEGFGPRK